MGVLFPNSIFKTRYVLFYGRKLFLIPLALLPYILIINSFMQFGKSKQSQDASKNLIE